MSTPVPTKRRTRADAAPIVARKAASGEPRGDESPVARVAESLRRTTLKAHRAINRDGRDRRIPDDLPREIDALEREVERLGLRGLRPFLKALRRRVEAALETGGEP